MRKVPVVSTTESAANAEKDGGNRLYWRANVHRLTAEQIRDSVLFVSGALDTKMGGPSIPLTPLAKRRTVYGKVSRYKLDEFLQLFDFPSASQSAEKRFSTNVPLQRLFFMNSDFMQQHAERLAARVVGEADDTRRVQKAYTLIFGRAATPAEVQAAKEFLAAEPMKQYEEKKAADAKKEADAKAKAAAAKPADGKASDAKPDIKLDVKPADATPAADAAPAAQPNMMSGVVPGKPVDKDAPEMLPVTVPATCAGPETMSASTTPPASTVTPSLAVSLPRSVPWTTTSSSVVISPSMVMPEPMTVLAMFVPL